MRSLQFIRRGQPIALANVPPDRTLLQVLREDLGHTGTKEGCGEGDCGACTVVIGEADGDGVAYRAINACICLAHSIDGKALWTAEDLALDPLILPTDAADPGSALHPVQQALVDHHASQCGFCTPGFVMSLFALYQNRVCHGQPVTREQAVQDLSGNLCRCTGYRPILDAAQEMHTLPRMQVDEAALLQQLELLALTHRPLEQDFSYISPTTLDALLAARAAHPQAQLVAGCTDAGLWVTKQHRQLGQVLDVTRVAELRQITEAADHTAIGAAVRLQDAFEALVQRRPQLHTFATRFAGLPVRNAGTLGGNIANGSPIGDSMPLLIALRARVVLASPRGERELPLEDLYTGYRQNVLSPDEVLARILVPHPAKAELLRAYKVSKRFDDDISAVCLVLCLHLEGGAVRSASIGAGGVAAVPARARQTEAALTGQPWDEAAVQRAAQALQTEFTPLSDMRASSAYRRTVLARLVQRFWLESQGHTDVSLESFRLEESA
jgi:xanthine dehydrogenase small subunit